jgi:hypothetical protein
MLAISAADAISPAIQRTRTFLFRPFRLGTYLKLCLVALLTEGLGWNSQFSSPGHHSSQHKLNLYSSTPLTHSSIPLTAGRLAMAVAALALAVVLSWFVYYLITRLRFAYFHCLIRNTKEIRPGWHLYRAEATRFFWLNIIVGLCFLLVVALIALPFVGGFWRLFRNVPAGGHPDFGSILSLVLPLIPIIFLVGLVALATDIVLRDLMLPHFALENATAGEAWRAVRTRIQAEKGPFFAYALLRVVLPIIALIALFAVLILPGIVFVAIIAAIELGLHTAFSDATGAGAVIGIVLGVLVGVVAIGTALLAGIGLGGPVSTAIREYSLLFYGGRYQRLGDILSPPPNGGLNPPVIA